MRTSIMSALGVALLSAGICSAQAGAHPYYNPANPASPTGFTTGYELYRTIGCPGKALMDRPCDVAAKTAMQAQTADKTTAASPAAAVAAPTPSPTATPAAAPTRQTKRTIVLKDVNFHFDSARLRRIAYATLQRDLALLNGDRYPTAEVAGYTDNIGTAAYNLKLSKRRAMAVRNYMVNNGYPPANLTVRGYGEANPIADNRTRSGRRENRRVELHVE
jgi:outer membrane protein OmpA-like peptidoglycan-associated protein